MSQRALFLYTVSMLLALIIGLLEAGFKFPAMTAERAPWETVGGIVCFILIPVSWLHGYLAKRYFDKMIPPSTTRHKLKRKK